MHVQRSLLITRIEARMYRSLRFTAQTLNRFHVLVGPNGSGKSTFLDVVGFLADLVADGLESAIEARTKNLDDLKWHQQGEGFELAIEAEIPRNRRTDAFTTVRYEVSVGQAETGEPVLLTEKVLLKGAGLHQAEALGQRRLFPSDRAVPVSLVTPKGTKGTKTVVNKIQDGNDNFYDETGRGWDHAFRLGPRKSALGNLPEDESRFPVATWLKGLLGTGVQRIVLNSRLMRLASPPGQSRTFKTDGSNLPTVVAALRRISEKRYTDWLDHVRTALPDILNVEVVEREDDRHRYLVVEYRGFLSVPSWMVSDGTLRLLALTLPAYLPELGGIYLVEEPENGVHPAAIDTIFQSLSSTYSAQVLLATHSPVILGAADASDVLCFAKTPDGATDIVVGSNHPALTEWKGETNLGVLFASGVLG